MDLYTNSKKKNKKKNKKNEDKKNKNENNENKKKNKNEKKNENKKEEQKETCNDATVWKFATRGITASAAQLLNADGQRWFVHVCASMLCSKRATLVRHTHIKRDERLFKAPQKRYDGGGEKLDLGGNKETLHAACLQLVQHRPGCRLRFHAASDTPSKNKIIKNPQMHSMQQAEAPSLRPLQAHNHTLFLAAVMSEDSWRRDSR